MLPIAKVGVKRGEWVRKGAFAVATRHSERWLFGCTEPSLLRVWRLDSLRFFECDSGHAYQPGRLSEAEFLAQARDGERVEQGRLVCRRCSSFRFVARVEPKRLWKMHSKVATRLLLAVEALTCGPLMMDAKQLRFVNHNRLRLHIDVELRRSLLVAWDTHDLLRPGQVLQLPDLPAELAVSSATT